MHNSKGCKTIKWSDDEWITQESIKYQNKILTQNAFFTSVAKRLNFLIDNNSNRRPKIHHLSAICHKNLTKHVISQEIRVTKDSHFFLFDKTLYSIGGSPRIKTSAPPFFLPLEFGVHEKKPRRYKQESPRFRFAKGYVKKCTKKQTSKQYSERDVFSSCIIPSGQYDRENPGWLLLGSCDTLPVLLIEKKGKRKKKSLPMHDFDDFVRVFQWKYRHPLRGWYKL